jgi:hypothetical protein
LEKMFFSVAHQLRAPAIIFASRVSQCAASQHQQLFISNVVPTQIDESEEKKQCRERRFFYNVLNGALHGSPILLATVKHHKDSGDGCAC